MAHFEFLRDVMVPMALDQLRRSEVLLSTYGDRSDENARRANEHLLSVRNSRKAQVGRLAGLQETAFLKQKRAEEQAFRQAVAANAALSRTCGCAWEEIAAALKTWRGVRKEEVLLERGDAFHRRQFGIARTIVRLVEEKPEAQRQAAARLSAIGPCVTGGRAL